MAPGAGAGAKFFISKQNAAPYKKSVNVPIYNINKKSNKHLNTSFRVRKFEWGIWKRSGFWNYIDFILKSNWSTLISVREIIKGDVQIYNSYAR